MCWNDFIEVDFTDACLAEADLRASTFADCDVSGADPRGAILDQKLSLSADQRKRGVWNDHEPGGG